MLTLGIAITFLEIYPRVMNMFIMYINFHGSFICNSKKVETIQMPANRWMDKHIVRYPYNGILRRNKKEWAIDISNNTHESQNNYAECKSDPQKMYLLHYPNCIKFWKMKNNL